nr:hypothetical protein [Tanacetum cinerariifolium]
MTFQACLPRDFSYLKFLSIGDGGIITGGRIGYENYNAVPPPYIGNFMPSKPDLSFTRLDEFVNNTVVENYEAKSSENEPKVIRKHNDALVIEEWVSDNEEEEMT